MCNYVYMMKTTEDIILDILKKRNCTSHELSYLSNKQPSTIRARISELRKKGYDIQTKQQMTTKYVLVQHPPTTSEKILSWIDNNNARGRDIKYSFLSKVLKIPTSEISNGYQNLFKTHRIIQTSNSSAKIL